MPRVLPPAATSTRRLSLRIQSWRPRGNSRLTRPLQRRPHWPRPQVSASSALCTPSIAPPRDPSASACSRTHSHMAHISEVFPSSGLSIVRFLLPCRFCAALGRIETQLLSLPRLRHLTFALISYIKSDTGPTTHTLAALISKELISFLHLLMSINGDGRLLRRLPGRTLGSDAFAPVLC